MSCFKSLFHGHLDLYDIMEQWCCSSYYWLSYNNKKPNNVGFYQHHWAHFCSTTCSVRRGARSRRCIMNILVIMLLTVYCVASTSTYNNTTWKSQVIAYIKMITWCRRFRRRGIWQYHGGNKQRWRNAQQLDGRRGAKTFDWRMDKDVFQHEQSASQRTSDARLSRPLQ